MLSLVLIRTIDRGSNAESQKKHRQRLNQTADAWGQKLRWQERQQLLYQKILSMDTKSETYTNLSCSLFTFYGILFPKLAESRCCLSKAERERERERTASQMVAITATYDGIMPRILFLHAINLLHTQSRKFSSNKWKKVKQYCCFHPIGLIGPTMFTPAQAPWTSLKIQLPCAK